MYILKNKIKKEYILIFVILFASCFYIFFTTDHFYYGDDLAFHLNRIIGIANAFKDGQIIPRIYPDVNYGFGYGSSFFYCDLFIYPFALLNLLNVSAITIYKIIIVFYSLVAVLTSVYFSKKVFNKTSSIVLFTALYMLSSYRLFDVYNRSALGEIIAISFIPLVLYSIYQSLYLKEDNYILLSISFSALVLSHMITTVLFSVLFAIFIILFIIKNIKQPKIILKVGLTVFKGTLLACLICAWFLLPMLEQMHSQDFYVFNFDSSFGQYPRVESLSNLINPINGINFFDIALFILSFLYLFCKKKRIITILLIMSIFLFLVMIGAIQLTYHIRFIQFMFRLNIIIYPFLTIIVTYIFENNNSLVYKAVYLLFAILFIVNFINKIISLYNDDERYYPINKLEYSITYDSEQKYYNSRQLAGGEYLPVCDHMDYLNGEKNIVLEDIKGYYIDTLKDFSKTYTHIEFDYGGEAKFVSLPLSYYKGYACYCDGEKIKCINDELFKKVGFYLNEGNHHYSIYYKGTTMQSVSLIISALACFFILFKYIRDTKIKVS